MSDGHKHDQEKPRMSLVFDGFANALTEVAKVGTFGANKYSDNGWMTVPNAEERYRAAMLRHYFEQAREGGNQLDDEMQLPHLAAVAWNALAILELRLRDNEH